MTKIKIFDGAIIGNWSIENDVNTFISDKKIIDIKYCCNSHTKDYHNVMVIYED